MESLSKVKTTSTQDSMTSMSEEYPMLNRRKRMDSKKRCMICGKDPYPNYFYCPSCHHRVENYEDYDL